MPFREGEAKPFHNLGKAICLLHLKPHLSPQQVSLFHFMLTATL